MAMTGAVMFAAPEGSAADIALFFDVYCTYRQAGLTRIATRHPTAAEAKDRQDIGWRRRRSIYIGNSHRLPDHDFLLFLYSKVENYTGKTLIRI